ncbi:MAG: HPr-like protein Crh [Candidatus Omnitrophica bacterium]|nr:HPr-like protein Crh [Candidatus Omnitrophota bacterium]
MILKKKITITNPQGLHARPASIFVQIANAYESEVVVRKDGEEVSGKSIMGLMTLAAAQGSEIEIEISGPDAQRAMEALETFLHSDGEEGSKKGEVTP